MSKKIYSAGLVSQRFWFYEIKEYIEMLNEGKTHQEIKKLSEEINIFGAASSSRSNETYNAAKRRINVLGKEMQELFPNLNIDNQKIVVLISVLLLNDLILEFMLEVYQAQIQKGILKLTTTDYKQFFSEKQRTNEIVASWQPYTYSRLGSAYRNYLLESGLIREDKGIEIITPKMVDSRVLSWLKAINRLDIAKAITGGI
ncbi:TPA: DUF1819 family protein [Enterococcus faecalis]|uniref:DUF1819 family protein n=1 Tax=Enterococcus TaxID=1350 RepID=UPI000A3545FD|nr:DUF1819 family protein [Enterococcus faecalis]EGO5147187.1 DUF1819 family protein [Enterococcus faecalis]EHA3055225.1 DUF1819 family protein [Enterococcus faecalis]EJM6076475.1 DUF1819 family protein [Enterococcus faecalis]EJZ8440947.1 DUF1819 family protein [Enterococcus faecalis]EME3218434.1 DUF1819 family protein [Enterococcus faecalis]